MPRFGTPFGGLAEYSSRGRVGKILSRCIEKSDAAQTIKRIGSRVICTHLHDNDGKKDQHLPPFKGIISWEQFLRGPTAAGYGGTYTFECGGALADIVEARRRFGEMLKPLAFTG